MHIHILGICGTFMGGVALLARAMGHRVSGSDANVYPPMSDMLAREGIEVMQGFEPAHLDPAPDQVVVGNALSRGNEAVESMLNRGLDYTSGPQWLARHLLRERWVLAVAGTHGKTTTSSMLAWILEAAGLEPGFLIGGVPENFGVSARVGGGTFFVVEADEYDTAFFDKRSKFVHYRPRTAVLNNLEFDHADIFPDLEAIQRQFHHLVRTVPGEGLIIRPHDSPALDDTLAMGCWTPQLRFGSAHEWTAEAIDADGSHFRVMVAGRHEGTVHWELAGHHNMDNALAALAAARHAGVPLAAGCAALGDFRNVKRRLELRGRPAGIAVYDDFAHHPTAIRLTIEALARLRPEGRVIAVLEPRSNTMRMGVHRATLGPALAAADVVAALQGPAMEWDLGEALAPLGAKARVLATVDAIIDYCVAEARPGDSVLIMSNGAFEGIHQRLMNALERHHDKA
ncbi:MAG: UDP-N-acetylmuramate:L-alanyl-gamma-D-glutamyl-meso-diaminopimelate ligase [Gammaproteobacteria bacterium]|nr:UDP-N-acetylmuramate:L-alanyl-gamma-D-glutamyl-meso-diaminopimelate ligase [Gammaproteobacteria bacterium]